MEHRREARGLQRLLHAGSVTVARGLSYPVACGILQDQSSSLRPLHWRMDSYPPPHWGGPSCSSDGGDWALFLRSD